MTDDSLWPHRSSIYHQTINRVDGWYNITFLLWHSLDSSTQQFGLERKGDLAVWCTETCEEFLLSFLIEWLTETCCPFHPTTTSIILILLIVKRLEDYQSGTGRWWLQGGQCYLKSSTSVEHVHIGGLKNNPKDGLKLISVQINFLPTHPHTFQTCYPSHQYNHRLTQWFMSN